VKLQGIFPPITTPFDYKGDLYKVKLQHNVSKWNLAALSGYVVCGSTGESVLLTAEEKVQVWEWAAESAAPERLLIAGTGAESVRETVALTNRAAAIGYHAALVRTPSYYRSLLDNAAAQALYFRAVADQAKVPVLIYNFPGVTGLDIAAETVAALSEHPNIVGVKESSGNVDKIARMVRESKPGFQVLVGSARAFLASLDAGAAGGVLAFADAAPYATIAIWEAFRAREREAAGDWQNRICHAVALTDRLGVPGLKHAMDCNGYYGGPPRLPLIVPSPAAKREIEEAFKDLKS
jgi:4-hydroxy-2-oxoglutarate aldolase